MLDATQIKNKLNMEVSDEKVEQDRRHKHKADDPRSIVDPLYWVQVKACTV